jgi:hypothetical protein
MKAIGVVLVAASLAASPLWADEVVRTCATSVTYRQFNLPRYERNYVGSLHFPLDAIVESALREVALIKLCQPDVQSPALYERVCELARDGNTPAVRYKASLVKLAFENPELFATEGKAEYRNDEEVFTAIARRLQVEVLAVVVR